MQSCIPGLQGKLSMTQTHFRKGNKQKLGRQDPLNTGES